MPTHSIVLSRSGLTSLHRKIAWRIIPFLMLCCLMNYIDRQNIGFSKLAFTKDIGISEAQYGLGGGLFYFGCLKGVLLPSDVPFNHGTALPITIEAPLGTLVNPRPPAPVRARMETSYRTYCAIMKALAQAAPHLVIASGADSTLATCFIGREANRFRLLLEVHGGGFGASPREDGADGIAASLSNVTNTPVEAIDMEFDHIRVVEYGLIDDSCGSGRFRGGLGLRRVYEVTADNVEFSCYGDRFRQRPEGLLGGTPGQNARCTIERDGVASVPDLSASTPLRRGDRVVIETAGGAGYGDPSSREPSRLEADAVAGFVRSAGHPGGAPSTTGRIRSA